MNSSQHERAPVKIWMHQFFLWIMGVIATGGYPGIVLLMAMESSIFPVPSEIVIPPAAYLACQPGASMSMVGVVIAGTLGSWIGASLTYLASARLGRPLLLRYGRIFRVTPERLTMMEGWVHEYGRAGVFFARLLPVVRHLIGIPAGLMHMNFWRFTYTTVAGAFLWCSILAWFGPHLITPAMFQDAEAMITELKHRTHVIAALALLMVASYAVMKWMGRRASQAESASN